MVSQQLKPQRQPQRQQLLGVSSPTRTTAQPQQQSQQQHLLYLLLLVLLSRGVNGTIFTHNETDGGLLASYPSLPALFGSPFLNGHLYEGRLLYLVDNPFLCDNASAFFDSVSGGDGDGKKKESSSSDDESDDSDDEGSESPHDNLVPIVLLASRGQCPFHTKAAVAESLSPRVQYLIINNHNIEGEDIVLPMYDSEPEYGSSLLRIMAVTHRTGMALKHYIKDSLPAQLFQGGPLLTMDSVPSDGLMRAQEIQERVVQKPKRIGLRFFP
eukprot:CAMPEP_0198140778 /NCGR_PEP_ID=MMETSP1443-20131203/3885_1 /TAXON_ID=186043 /ORGANISM="Entomoneis sp., Strain CCMP2396" /LENGTH=269 /DNA_ID=CAMNT_0043803307 /DNA_START=103 /DNA_END=912 /DNA_ORIENTATION=+